MWPLKIRLPYTANWPIGDVVPSTWKVRAFLPVRLLDVQPDQGLIALAPPRMVNGDLVWDIDALYSFSCEAIHIYTAFECAVNPLRNPCYVLTGDHLEITVRVDRAGS